VKLSAAVRATLAATARLGSLKNDFLVFIGLFGFGNRAGILRIFVSDLRDQDPGAKWEMVTVWMV
jgi:hypothetical protein